jgi:chromosome partitioning protein
MAVVITVAQQKGGAGKTTLAANLAATFGASARVALIDIDPQRSLTRWHDLRKARLIEAASLTFSDVSGWRLASELDRLRKTHDLVLIDSPPQIDTDAKLAVRSADLVLVPVQPSPPDIWAAEGTLKLAFTEGRRAVLVLNRVLDQALGNRTAYATAFAEGLGVTEAAPRSAAADELRSLVAQIRKVTE